MNKKIGIIGSIINVISIVAFTICILIDFSFGSYFVCIFLSLSFIMMIAAFKMSATKIIKLPEKLH